MRTAVIGPFPPYRGGIAQFSSRLLSALREASPEDELSAISYRRLYPSFLFPGRSQFEPGYSSGSTDTNPEQLIDSSVPIRWPRTRKLLKLRQLDRMIVQWWHPFFAPCLLHSLPEGPRLKRAAVCHNVFPHESFPMGRHLSRRFLSRMDLLVVHSDSDLEQANSVSPDIPVLRLYHPIYDQYLDDSVERSASRDELGFSDTDRVVLFFGLIRPYKGLTDLMDAVSLLPADVKLLIAGECYSDREEISSRLASADLEKRVVWIDRFVPDADIAKVFSASDVVALPYRSATQSGVAQIALSFGKPLVLTRTGGLPDLLNDGVTGMLADPCDPGSISKALRGALALSVMDSTRGAVIEKSREFSWERYADRLMEAFE